MVQFKSQNLTAETIQMNELPCMKIPPNIFETKKYWNFDYMEFVTILFEYILI